MESALMASTALDPQRAAGCAGLTFRQGGHHSAGGSETAAASRPLGGRGKLTAGSSEVRLAGAAIPRRVAPNVASLADSANRPSRRTSPRPPAGSKLRPAGQCEPGAREAWASPASPTSRKHRHARPGAGRQEGEGGGDPVAGAPTRLQWRSCESCLRSTVTARRRDGVEVATDTVSI